MISAAELNDIVDENWKNWPSKKKFEIGEMLYNGTNAPKNEVLALDLLQSAAKDNFGEAISLLAEIKFDENPVLAYQMMLKLGQKVKDQKQHS